MVKCKNCKKSVRKTEKVVVETRNVSYPEREYIKNHKKMNDRGGTGWEIVKELVLCLECKVK